MNPLDFKAVDVLYHKLCWLQNVFNKTRTKSAVGEREKIARAAAEVEVVEEVKRLLDQGAVLSMCDAESLYTGTFEDKGVSGFTTRKSIKKFLKEKIPDLEPSSSTSVNAQDMIHLSGTRSKALQALSDEELQNFEEQFMMMFKVAKLIRNDFEPHPTWKFSTTLEGFEVPQKLQILLNGYCKVLQVFLNTRMSSLKGECPYVLIPSCTRCCQHGRSGNRK